MSKAAEAPWALMVFDGKGLLPVAAMDLELLSERYVPGTELRTKFAQARSRRHHRLYWAVLRAVCDVTEHHWANAEALSQAIKMELRMVGEGVRLFNGEIRYELQSIDFESMDQGKFKIFFEKAMTAVGDATCLDMDVVIADVKSNIAWSQSDEDAFNGVTRIGPKSKLKKAA